MYQLRVWPVPYTCAQPYHPASDSYGKLFGPYWGSSVWHSRRVNERGGGGGGPPQQKTLPGGGGGGGGGGGPAHQKPFPGEASVKHSFKRQLHDT